MESSEKAQKWVTVAFVILILVACAFTLALGTAKCAWFVGIIGLLAATGVFFFLMSLLGGEIRRHVLDITAHPGGLETINQDIEKIGNLISEHREALNQIPEIRNRVDRLEAWEADLAKGGQALEQIQKLSKEVSELGVHTSSRCEGLGASLRELHKKLGDLDAMRQRMAELEKLAEYVPAIREELGKMGTLSEQVVKLEAQTAELGALPQALSAIREGMGRVDVLADQISKLEAHAAGVGGLSQDVSALKDGIARLDALNNQVRRLEEHVASLGTLAQDVAALKQSVASVADVPDEVRKMAEQFAERFTSLTADASLLAQEVKTLKGVAANLSSLGEQAGQSAGLAQDVAAIKEGMAADAAVRGTLSNLPDELRKLAEQSAQRASALAEEIARLKAQLDQQRQAAQGLEALQAEVKDLAAQVGGMAKLGDEIQQFRSAAGEIVKLQEQSQMIGQVAAKAEEIGAKIAEVEGVKAQLADVTKALAAIQSQPAAAPSGGAAIPADAAAKLEALTSELSTIKKTVSELQAEQPNLDINIKEAKLVSQQDRTVVVCTLLVRNLSNKPNEITAVRAELDSGRNRLAPTSIRHWLPDGKQTNEERLILLPQKLLEKSTSGPITLTAIGWPLEKSEESYAFRITLKDKNGNEYIKNHRLVPEGGTTS